MPPLAKIKHIGRATKIVAKDFKYGKGGASFSCDGETIIDFTFLNKRKEALNSIKRSRIKCNMEDPSAVLTTSSGMARCIKTRDVNL